MLDNLKYVLSYELPLLTCSAKYANSDAVKIIYGSSVVPEPLWYELAIEPSQVELICGTYV